MLGNIAYLSVVIITIIVLVLASDNSVDGGDSSSSAKGKTLPDNVKDLCKKIKLHRLLRDKRRGHQTRWLRDFLAAAHPDSGADYEDGFYHEGR